MKIVQIDLNNVYPIEIRIRDIIIKVNRTNISVRKYIRDYFYYLDRKGLFILYNRKDIPVFVGKGKNVKNSLINSHILHGGYYNRIKIRKIKCILFNDREELDDKALKNLQYYFREKLINKNDKNRLNKYVDEQIQDEVDSWLKRDIDYYGEDVQLIPVNKEVADIFYKKLKEMYQDHIDDYNERKRKESDDFLNRDLRQVDENGLSSNYIDKDIKKKYVKF